uniref:Uncharacterized protein n=1 Tax=Leersia perrieri TaxID=77586 RepID=A0A0D9X705_9ORYZ
MWFLLPILLIPLADITNLNTAELKKKRARERYALLTVDKKKILFKKTVRTVGGGMMSLHGNTHQNVLIKEQLSYSCCLRCGCSFALLDSANEAMEIMPELHRCLSKPVWTRE